MAAVHKRTRLILGVGFTLGLLAMVVVGMFALRSTQHFIQSANNVEESHLVLTRLEEMMRVLTRAESEQRGYLLTTDPRYLQHYDRAPVDIARDFDVIVALRRDTESRRILEDVERLIERRFQLLDDLLDLRRSEGLQVALDVIAQNEGLETMNELRERVEELKRAETDRLQYFSLQNQLSQQRSQWIIPGGIGFSVLAVLLAMAIVLRDSARRMRAERELQLAVALQSAVLNSANISIIAVDKKGTITLLNHTAERWLGYRADELLGIETPLLFHDDKEIAEKLRELERRFDKPFIDPMAAFTEFAIREGIDEGRWTYVRKDGSRFSVALAVTALRDDRGEVFGYVGLAADLTAQLEAQRTLDAYVQELEAAREELQRNAIELEASRDAAIAAANLKSEFLANMSHEIRTPMNGVLGMVHLLMSSRLGEKERLYARTIQQSAESLLAILNDILDLSKMEAGKLNLEHYSFDLRELIEDCVASVAPVAHGKDLELNAVMPPALPTRVIGDPNRIRQVLTNLLSNAIKFTERGEVVLSAEIERRSQHQARYRVSVRDTGIGIPAGRLESIFESFTQADGSTTRRFGGTGLGLTITRQLVELMGGEITVSSIVGVGSEFSVSFPLQVDLGAGDDESRREALRGARVLVVDDNATNRLVLRELLGGWGCEVEEFEGAREALAGIERSTRYSAAILDFHMPDMNGAQLAEEILQHPRHAGVPLVMLASSAALEEPQRELFRAVLTKPIRSQALYETLSALIYGSATVTEEPVREVGHPLAGLRVLIVEDNPINQMVVGEMLRSWGALTVSVENGRSAVAAVADERFDAVLMDVQMPEMDGLEATTLIREAEGSRHTPIIATTANAMRGDREKCLKAGMDDYLPKPIQPEDLLAAILRVTGTDVAQPASEPTKVIAVFDPSQLVRACAGNLGIVRQALERYLDNAQDTLPLLEGSDAETRKRAAHTLKGSSLTVGAVSVAEAASDLERGTGSTDALRVLLAETASLIERYLAEAS
jgi:PAS domain S-box-containing protein